ncbi:MAG TPA: tRNA (adenosine(37)-N6)-threonylcarbamoyltransferase complex dimerization subunit type 1 TsaB [Elusimicrobiota bacterium]|nr:tRNA (adenosine(37)-N6)-threonylcarbamoyltransferase complex dimerization subunit type 1 TsaB [Elusimicrobiota bacterium]
MKMLALETTGSTLGACLWEDAAALRSKVAHDSESHSVQLVPMLHQLFRECRVSPAQLDAVAVDVGPGRFTGLRLGVVTARTLGMVLQKPVVEVSSLEVLAAQSSGWEPAQSFSWKFPWDLLCSLIEAPQENVYVAAWRFHRASKKMSALGPAFKKRSTHSFGHHFKLVHAPCVFPFPRFQSFFENCFSEQKILFTGCVSKKIQDVLRRLFQKRCQMRMSDRPELQPRWVAALAAEKYFRREYKLYKDVHPLYLRPSYAEEALMK